MCWIFKRSFKFKFFMWKFPTFKIRCGPNETRLCLGFICPVGFWSFSISLWRCCLLAMLFLPYQYVGFVGGYVSESLPFLCLAKGSMKKCSSELFNVRIKSNKHSWLEWFFENQNQTDRLQKLPLVHRIKGKHRQTFKPCFTLFLMLFLLYPLFQTKLNLLFSREGA